MKNKLQSVRVIFAFCFLLSAVLAPAQTISLVDTTTIHTVGTNVIKGDQPSIAFGKINSNFTAVAASIAIVEASIVQPPDPIVLSNGIVGWVQNQQYVSALQTNVVLSSHRTTLFTTNVFTMSGSNYIGRFSQLYDWNLIAPQVAGVGIAPPTSLPEALWGSYDGVTGWFALTNNFVCWTNISLSVVGTNITGVGGVSIYGLDHPELYGNVISFDGQTWLSNGKTVATMDDLSAYIHVLAPPVQMAGNWLLNNYVTTNGTGHVIYSAYNVAALDLTSFARGITIDYFNRNITGWYVSSFTDTNSVVFYYTNAIFGTNFVLHIAASNMISGWVIETCTNLVPPIQWQPFVAATVTTNAVEWMPSNTGVMTTNTGEVSFVFPCNFAIPAQFFRARGVAVISASCSVPLALPALLLTPTTVTNATDPAAGPGLVCIDTNYVYVSVGTNRWKRSALSTW